MCRSKTWWRSRFILADDSAETRDLAIENPAKVQELAALFGTKLRVCNAQMPLDKATGEAVEWPDKIDR